MQTFETAAVISLVDHLSGPLGKLATHVGATGTAFDKHSAAMVAAGKKMTYAYTLPTVMLGKHLMDSALEFDKVENTLQGVLAQRHKTMKDLTQTHDEYAKAQRKIIDQSAEMAYKNSGGMVDVLEYRKSTMAGIKAGFDTSSSTAIAGNAFNLSLAGRIDQHEAADQLITLANSFHLKLKDAQGNALPSAQLNKAFGSMADLLTTMSTNANMTEKDAFESLKLSAPLAHLTRLNPLQLGVLSETMAESGFKGSEAGVALRSVMGALTAPKSTAVPMLRDAGIDINKFRTFKPDYDMGAAHFEKYAQGLNYSVNHREVMKAYARAHAMADSSGGALSFEGALSDTLAPILRTKGKHQKPVGPDLARKRVMDFVSAGAETIDMFGAVMEMRDKHLTGSQLAKFMEKRQIPRALSFLGAPEPGQNDVFGTAMARSFGEDWEEQVRKFRKAGESYGEALEHLAKNHGAAAALALEHADNIEGGYRRIASSFKHLEGSLYKAGVFDAAAQGLRHIATAIDKIAGQSPAMLKFEAGAVALVAGLGPLLLIAGRMAQIGKALKTGTEWMVETPAAAEAKKAATDAAKVEAETAAKAGAKLKPVEAPALPEGFFGKFGNVAKGLAKGGVMGLVQSYALDYAEKKIDDALGMTPGQKAIRDEGIVASANRVLRHFKQGKDRSSTGGEVEIVLDEQFADRFNPIGELPERRLIKLPRMVREGSDLAERIHAQHDARNLPVMSREGSYGGFGFRPRSEMQSVPTSAMGWNVEPQKPTAVTVTGDIKGEATLVSSIKVDPSPLLLATVNSAQQTVQMGLSGKLGQTMKGSNASVSSVSPGLSAFKPSVSGR